MLTKIVADCLCQNITYISTKYSGFGVSRHLAMDGGPVFRFWINKVRNIASGNRGGGLVRVTSNLVFRLNRATYVHAISFFNPVITVITFVLHGLLCICGANFSMLLLFLNDLQWMNVWICVFSLGVSWPLHNTPLGVTCVTCIHRNDASSR